MKHADYIDYLNRVFTEWPDMRCYIHTARLQQETFLIGDTAIEHECINVTLFDKRDTPDDRHDERNQEDRT